MRNKILALTLFLGCFGPLTVCQDEVNGVNQTQPTTVQDLDMQIKLIQQQIDKYSGVALAFQRKAERMQFQDFESYRHDAKLAEICQGIANDLKARLQAIEEQKAKLSEKKEEKKE